MLCLDLVCLCLRRLVLDLLLGGLLVFVCCLVIGW